MSEGQNDVIWAAIRDDVIAEAAREPILASFLHATVLKHVRLEDALSFHLAGKLSTGTLPDMLIRELIDDRMYPMTPAGLESAMSELAR